MRKITIKKYQKVLYKRLNGELGYARVRPIDRIKLNTAITFLRKLGLDAARINTRAATKFLRSTRSSNKRIYGHIYKPSRRLK